MGIHANLQPKYDANGAFIGCQDTPPNIDDPYITDPQYPELLYIWQNEMCRYIKQQLGHTQHPLGVNYTGTPKTPDASENDPAYGCNMFAGDSSYYSEYVDFWTWNNYTATPERHELNVKLNEKMNPNGGIPESVGIKLIDKPLMYSEIGLPFSNCDHDLTWKNMIAIAPFDGSTGGIPYDRNNNFTTSQNIAERNELWKTYGYVNNFLSGVELNDDDWYFGYDDRDDDYADVTYIRKKSAPQRAMGAIQNKTVNYYTLRDQNLDPDSKCFTNGIAMDNDTYKTAIGVDHAGGNDRLFVKNMGFVNHYRIEWYNPFTGEYSGSTDKWSTIDGKLRLEFPKLEGVRDSNVVLFKAYRFNEPSFQPENPINQAKSNDYLLKQFDNLGDHKIESADVHRLKTLLADKILLEEEQQVDIRIVPNPSNSSCRVFFSGDAEKLEILNSMGSIVKTIALPKSGEKIDVSNLSHGIYTVRIFGFEMNLHTKMMKE